MDDDIDVSSDVEDVRVYRDHFDDVVDYIVDKIDWAMPYLYDVVDDATTETGRITKSVAAAFKAKTLVLAASDQFANNSTYANIVDNKGNYIFPRNLTSDERIERWARAARAVNDAIVYAHDASKSLYQSYPYVSLYYTPSDYTQTLVTLQTILSEGWDSPEIIFATDDSPASFQGYCAPSLQVGDYNQRAAANLASVTLNVVEDYYTSNGVPMSEDKEWIEESTWYDSRYEAVEIEQADNYAQDHDLYYYGTGGQYTARINLNREPRFYANIGFDRGSWYIDQCRDETTTVPKLMLRKGDFGNSSLAQYNVTGYNNKKICGVEVYIYGNTEQSVTTQRYAYPLIRLSDLYLLYAECLNEVLDTPTTSVSSHATLSQEETDEYGNVSPALSAGVVQYIDLVRSRAGLSGVVASWTNYSVNGWLNDQSQMREIIRNERKSELALEGQRFWDMRRWLEAPDAIRGWNTNGITVDEYYQVLEVTPRDIKYSYKDYLWPISRSAILGNPNFVQNPGW